VGLDFLLLPSATKRKERRRKDLDRLGAIVEGGIARAEVRDSCLAMTLLAEPGAPYTARFSYRPMSGRGAVRRMEWARPLVTGLVAEAEFVTSRPSPTSAALFRFLLSWHDYGTPISYEILYRLIPERARPETTLVDSTRVLVLVPAKPGETRLVFDLTEAARLLRDGEDATLTAFEWGVEARDGDSASLGMRSVEFRNTRVDPASFLESVRCLADRYEDEYGVQARIGAEFSWENPHLNGFFPDSSATPEVLNPDNRARPIGEWVSGVHERGGAVSLNHPLGVSADRPDEDDGARRKEVVETAARILAKRAYGADILEVGYPRRGGLWLRDHLFLWDLLTANGLPLYGDGTSDSHGDIWFSPEAPNGLVTWVWAADSGAESLIRGMRDGRMSFGDIGRWDGAFDFRLGSYRCGDRVPVPGADLPLRVLLDPFPEGASVRLVQGLIEENPGGVTYLHDGTEIDPGDGTTIRVDRPCFVRLEVYLPPAKKGEREIPLLFSNPIVFR
jgi:hypothetical protein